MSRKHHHEPLDPEMDPKTAAELDPEVQPDQPADEGGQPDSADDSGPERGTAQETGDLVAALVQKTNEAATANEKYLRTYADFENYRKRMQREQADFRKYANEQMALELLTVVDHLGLALKHANESGGSGEGLQQGVELVYKQFRDVLEKFGIKPFKAQGEPFDPAMHDAMMQIETADVPENTVAQVFQDGYLYHEKILRHAKVGVSKRPVGGAAGTPAEQADSATAPTDDDEQDD